MRGGGREEHSELAWKRREGRVQQGSSVHRVGLELAHARAEERHQRWPGYNGTLAGIYAVRLRRERHSAEQDVQRKASLT